MRNYAWNLREYSAQEHSCPGKEAGLYIIPGKRTFQRNPCGGISIYDDYARMRKIIFLVVIAGKEYGTGSSRDWAAKGTFLLGVKAVIAESFERIHRSNLVGICSSSTAV